jgi:sugar lactone lactonase YvrE
VRTISVAAGTGTAGFSGDNGPATAAMLNSPSDVSVDASGDFYIADRNNNRVRKVDSGSGVIKTAAGNGSGGWFFSGGPAVFASLDHPSGVVVDSAGNYYIADLLENDISRVHKVDTAGIITRIDLPVILKGAVAIALDSDGNLYIAEQVGHRIRKVVLSSGAMTTIAGTGAPGFFGDGGPATSAVINGPTHLSIDPDGNIYFSDSLNNRIRKISRSGIITTVAGSGATGGPGGFSGDGGPATSAQLNNPQGVAVDGEGNIFIADTANARIRRVNAKTGVITTLVSSDLNGASCSAASSAMKSPGSLSVNAAGTILYIADDDGNRVWRVTLDPNIPAPTLTSIAPATGIIGTSVAVTLTGSGFLGGASAVGGSGCQINGTTIFVSGTGVTVANVSVTRDDSLNATFNIAPNASLDARNVTVTTDAGTTGPVTFTIVAVPVPPPTLASITPASGARGATVTVSLAGNNFDLHPGGTAVLADGTGISITVSQVSSIAALTATFNIAVDATLGLHNVKVSTAGGTSNVVGFTVLPQGPSFTSSIPQLLNPTDQTPIELGLATEMAESVTGRFMLTFVPNANFSKDDPNVTFINSQLSTRSVDVTFPPQTNTAEISLPSGVLQAGTVAGTIQLTVTDVQVGGMNTAPASGDFNVEVPRLPPVITNVRLLNRSKAGFDVEITGYSTSREIGTATFDFGAASGAHLLTVQLTPDVTSTFTTYYQSDASAPVGGSFVYVQPFIVQQGDGNVVSSVTVTLTNSVGASEPATAK